MSAPQRPSKEASDTTSPRQPSPSPQVPYHPPPLPGSPRHPQNRGAMSSPMARQQSPASPGPSGAIVTPAPIPDQTAETDMPMTMSASVILTTLPGDARKALETATGARDTAPPKITVHFNPLRDAPSLKQTRYKITATRPFSAVISFLRGKLRLKDADSLWCYIGNFSPSPDEGVDGLFNCFKTGDELSVGYSITPTFG
ncbi:ubiquitin-like protein [Microthyrium microscopicum]|uniref:Ubiquitin-like protein ATG12 n=1 Tax=Microthyrium microscopicum TaxID=703497 RepID=A0A6A6UE60_9PEZI|nr:ubiquitin-like protein [Microthyrium microscopicum]